MEATTHTYGTMYRRKTKNGQDRARVVLTIFGSEAIEWVEAQAKLRGLTAVQYATRLLNDAVHDEIARQKTKTQDN